MLKKLLYFVVFILLFYCCKKNKQRNYSKEELKELKQKLTEVNRIITQKEIDRIRTFIRRNKWDMNQTNIGVWYMIIKKSNNKIPIKKGDKIEIKYKLSLLDGTLCYSSDSLGNKIFIVGNGEVEKGLDEGIKFLNEGDIARFIIPSFLGYGIQGDNNCIPPRSTIIYEIEVVKRLIN